MADPTANETIADDAAYLRTLARFVKGIPEEDIRLLDAKIVAQPAIEPRHIALEQAARKIYADELALR